jgi:hypothetical protein
MYSAFPFGMIPVDVTIRDPLAGRYTSVRRSGTIAQQTKHAHSSSDVLVLAQPARTVSAASSRYNPTHRPSSADEQ